LVNTHSTGAALRRRDEILKVIREHAIHSQEELQQRLAERGFAVAQPTLSRDLKDLGLAKTPSGYVAPDPGEAFDAIAFRGRLRERQEERLTRAIDEFVLSVARAGTLVVIKTPPAAAHPVARAIDEASIEGAVGTIAGDDTIFLAAETGDAAARLAARLSATLNQRRSARRPRV
jgi:transcriptional regulator of arginine metabolism